MSETGASSSESTIGIPEQGQLVEARRRPWVVSEIVRSSPIGVSGVGRRAEPQHLVSLSSIEEDALGEELEVVWEIEPGARVLERAGLPEPTGFDDPVRLDAFLDAVRWGAATNADVQALQSPFRSGIAIEDYQLEPVVRAIQIARANLLIADDVGLGKTIEAGLVVQELLLRHRARTILVVCPASLLLKWQSEMSEKFGLEFRIVDTTYLKELRRSRGIHANPWTSFPRLITSIDWLKNDVPMRLMRDVLPVIPTYPRKFDVLIVDEAHNVAPAGSANYALDSLRTQAIRAIAPHFEHRLFLSATPHNGYQESFTSLLELLDDQRFARGITPDQESVATVMVRRLKSDIVDDKGNGLFPTRVLKPLEVQYSDEERRVHAALVEYGRLRRAAIAASGASRATEFVLKLLKKRLFSSPAAFAATLERHRETLAGKRAAAPEERLEERILHRAIQQADEDYANDEEREAAQNEAAEVATALLVPLSDRERELLEEMSRWAEREKGRSDSKARALIQWMNQHLKPSGTWSDERAIVFTEYRATQKWLVDVLTASGFGGQDRLMTIYGGMDPEKREAVKAAFQANPSVSPVRVLVATDAASEGIDLQNHCHMMVHAEIPWNPNVLEQRNGRIDRHGQRSKDVTIWHPVGAGYREREFGADVRVGDLEGDLEFLMIAARKVEAIRHDLGKVGPVIASQVEEAMLGQRQRMDTARAETQAAEAAKQLAVERKFREKAVKLHQRLVESRDAFRMSPDNVESAVRIALDVAGLPKLQPVELAGAPAGTVFRMPAFQGTWARCAEGLAHPHTGERRPITFDHDVAKDRDDVVLVHLNHRLVQMCLRLLRAEVWASNDVKRLHRVTARTVPDGVLDQPAVMVWARLVVTGARSHRLHEEVIFAGGTVKDGKFARFNVTRAQELLAAASSSMPPSTVLNGLVAQWSSIEDSVRAAIEARTAERMKYLGGTLERRRDQEMTDVTGILTELRASIERELGRPVPSQLAFWSTEEQDQLRRNRHSLEARVAAIPKEIEEGTAAIRARYADPAARTFPVALTFLVPESMARSGS